MTTFDLKSHFTKAVTANIHLWQRRLLEEAESADRWRTQHHAVWQAVETGLRYASAQAEAADLAVSLLPVIERWGVWLDWLPLFDKAMLLELPPDLQIRLRLTQGRLHNLNRNFTDALELLKAALLLADENQLSSLKAVAHYRLTNAYLGSKVYSRAREHATKSLNLLSPTELKLQASIYNSLGLIDLETDALTESKAWFLQALALWEKVNEPIQLSRCCLNLSVVYQKQARWDEAKAILKQASAALSATDSEVDKLKVLNALGTLQYMTKEVSSAAATLRQGVEAAGQLQGMYHLRGSLTHNLGNALLALEQWTEARAYLERSIVLWQQANDNLERANSLGTLGELFEAQAEWFQAVHRYDQALELLAFFQDHPWGMKLAAQFKAARARCAALADPAAKKN